MDGYPAGSLDHNVPFLVAAGLNSETNELPLNAELRDQGILLRSELPPLETKEAEVLAQYFEEIDAQGKSWSGVEREETHRFRIRTLGRSFTFPPRRARLPEDAEPLSVAPTLHSPFSPLSPVSTLYPDGLIDTQWIKKHRELVPSVYLCFYTLTSDPTTTTLHDNHIKADINNLRSALARSGYKTRLAVVLLGESGAPLSISDGISERLENIRRGTALDPKSVFYIPPQDSPAELKGVIDSILGVLYTTAVEYYRDLGRHARKKRSRGIAPQPTVPPTSGTSQTLSLPDWNFRYDFKSAVFAEFRQEIDAALRSFEQAYEVLLGQDVLDIIPSWSPRWNEARLLSDLVAIRCLRCHMWIGQTTLAVRRWQSHRDRIGDFVDRRGRGTNNYGWQAWEARWATVMANLIEKVGIPSLAPATMTLFLQPEKAVLGERLQPWELLHHTGYWYRIAARHTVARRRLAFDIPEEDRNPPDASPASLVASKAYTYDTYMCPEPFQEYPVSGKGVNHSELIINCLKKAYTQFKARNQTRIAAEISLDCAREMANLEQWDDAAQLLLPLWENTSFRSEGWNDISEELCWVMRRVASGAGRAELVVAADWELMNNQFHRRPQWTYDIKRSLEGVASPSKPSISLSDNTTRSFVSASLIFRNKEGGAGETCNAQLALTSHTFLDAAPLSLDSLKVEFSGNLKPILLKQASEGDDKPVSHLGVSISFITLKEDVLEAGSEDDLPTVVTGQADLTLKPGQTRVFEMRIPLREPGTATASSVILFHSNETFSLDYTAKFRETDRIVGWYVEGSARPRHTRPQAQTIQIQPRPPKMEVKLSEPLGQYYANEPIELHVELLNAEDESASVKLDVHLAGKEVPGIRVQAEGREGSAEAAEGESNVSGLVLGSIGSASSFRVVVSLDPAKAPTTFNLHLRATYHLASDSATSILQTLPIHLNVVNAFEANYDLVPRLHSEPWPSLFDYEGLLEAHEGDAVAAAKGFAQKWCLLCHYASFAQEDLKVVGMELDVLSCVGGARCNVVQAPNVSQDGVDVAPKTMHEAQFDLVAQKLSLEDRQPVTLDLAFVVQWQRKSRPNGLVNITRMPVGKYLVLGTEPRVLASVYRSSGDEPNLVQLDVTIENPSNHFLTFGLTMEPSDQFAFSGSKQTTLNLLPQSRRVTTYRMLPLVAGTWVRPGLTVRDKYFQKVLRIIPTEGMKIDKDGLLIWVPGQKGEDEDREGEGEGEAAASEAN
ncbi:Gryzun, putative trafficking through golgi-domain-containing protein [Dactylonectria macrodidyma]|uniref:Gryzun, putative trafficking through golgi-domain-containing protein n=1 Tax=Dactylonectria macrodidyma TaxID=307937 RepID=A0A9P9JII0_9HYPO|nr:Gryzun, putative trafficking through golgi-domain-containing protein [Dactylonectria macrodidyma]